MTTTLDADAIDRLIQSWELQQDAYVADRTGRFAVAIDAVSYAVPDVTTVVDLAAGLGSFSALVLERLPNARVIAIDHDPALLELARHNLRRFGDRARVEEANLLDPQWAQALGPDHPQAFVSSTALHWLPNGRLVSLYEEVAAILRPGGIIVNADHLSLADEGSFRRTSAEADDRRQQEAAFDNGTLTWDAWWESLRNQPGFADLVAERDRRFGDSASPRDTTPRFHAAALQVAGFREAGTVWQRFDDYVVYGIR